jgi:DNA repair exonuclease SbcCD nuclease subunit
MKIVHSADLHLDSPLRGLKEYEGAPLSEVRAATRSALGALVDLCLRQEAKLLLIAGDLYDGDFRDYSTALFFTEQMARLRAGGTRVVWLRGNHDAANRITRHLRTAEHVTELSHESPASVVFEDLGVALHGQGYAARDVHENLARGYPEPNSGLLNIGLLHTALDGREGHAPYAPCTVAELKAKGYDYWALGHVHQREVLSEQPWIVFPGNLQGRHIRETGPKGVTVVEVENDRIVSVQPHTLDQVRWELAEVDVTGAQSLSDVLDAATREMSKRRGEAEDRVLAMRVRLIGMTEVHGIISRRQERIDGELRAHAVDQGDIYLERVQFSTVSELSAEALAQRRDALGDLFREMDATVSDEAARKRLWDDLLRPLSGVSADLLSNELIDPKEIFEEARHLLEGRLLSVEEEP